MTLLLGIDFGTSYFKVGVFDRAGALCGLARIAVNKHAPAPDRCELPVDVFWTALRRGLAAALEQAHAPIDAIAGISYSSQSSTFLLLDRDVRPLTPLIMWTDERGAPVPRDMAAFSRSAEFRQVVGFEGMTGQSAPAKWRWFARNAPAIWSRAARIMTLSDYFTYSLTGRACGDASTAAFLGLYDLAQGGWWPEALRVCGVEPGRLSQPLLPGAACGATSEQAARLLGLRPGIPFAVGALDHHAAAIGSGLGTLADLSISTGTVLAALVLVDAPEPLPGCFHGRHVDGRRFYRLAFDPKGAGQLEEYQRAHGAGHSIEELLQLAAHAKSGARPPDPLPTQLSAADHGAAVRQILERVSDTHRRLVATVLAGRRVGAVVATGGGSRSALWLQINADALGVPVVTPTCVERACLGAAAFAAVAAGWYADLPAALGAMVRAGDVYSPASNG